MCGRKIRAEFKTPERGREQVPLGLSFASSDPGQSLGYKDLNAILVFQNNGTVSPAIICGSQEHPIAKTTILFTLTPLSLSLGLQTLTTGHLIVKLSSVPSPTSPHITILQVYCCPPGFLVFVPPSFFFILYTSLATLNFHPWSSEEAKEHQYSGVGPTSGEDCIPLALSRMPFYSRCSRTVQESNTWPSLCSSSLEPGAL